ncbi:MAG: hypothetical protein EBR82_83360, partial [Caulobacteraceae bacterium]|nr:hypothetical protein [Caulobacteraceae bacterium]
ELVKNINEYKTENALASNVDNAVALLQTAQRMFGVESPQAQAAYDNWQNAQKDYFALPGPSQLKQTFVNYWKAAENVSPTFAETWFEDNYKPGMGLQELWIKAPKVYDVASSEQSVFVDKSGNPITGQNPAELYRLSSFVGIDPVTGKQIRAVNSSQGKFFYDPDIGLRVANLLQSKKDLQEMTGGKFGTFIEGTNIPYVPGGGKTDQVQVSGTPSVKPDATVAAAKSIAADLSGLADASGKITYDQIIDYATKNNVSLANVASAINVPTETLTKYQNDKLVNEKIKEAAGTDNILTYDELLSYVENNNISLADAAAATNIPLNSLTKYKTDKAITSGLQAASGSDGKLSYDELFKFADESGTSLEDIARLTNTPISDLNTYKSQKLVNDKIQ